MSSILRFCQPLCSAVTLGCRWNQSFESGNLQCRSSSNTSHSDVRPYYAADNKISQLPLSASCYTGVSKMQLPIIPTIKSFRTSKIL